MTLSPDWLQQIGDARDAIARADSIQKLSDSYAYFTRGYHIDAAKIIQDGLMPAGASRGEEISAGPIPFYSLCEHHMLPFFGTANITYTAGDYILGFGKFPKVVEALAARLTLQENLATLIADTLHGHLKPLQITVTLEARHLCLDMRGPAFTGSLLKTVKKR